MGVGGSSKALKLPQFQACGITSGWEIARKSFESIIWSLRVVNLVVNHYVLNIRTNTTSFTHISVIVTQLISRNRNMLLERPVVIKPCFAMLKHRGYRNNIERQNSPKEVMHCVLRRTIDLWLPLASWANYLNFNNENLKR